MAKAILIRLEAFGSLRQVIIPIRNLKCESIAPLIQIRRFSEDERRAMQRKVQERRQLWREGQVAAMARTGTLAN